MSTAAADARHTPQRRGTRGSISRLPSGSLRVRVYATTHPVPDALSRQYHHLVTQLGIRTTLHKLRHYSATELITAGVDLRTVAGRLGHADNGRTTLRYYTAWINEADQRASHTLMHHLPTPHTPIATRPAPTTRPPNPYLAIVADLHTAITTGALSPGATLPTTQQLAATHHVASSTAHRALTLLAPKRLITATPGRRPIANPTAAPTDR
jgi:integrase